MRGIYSLLILLYLLAVRVVALFDPKVKRMVQGHRQTFHILHEKVRKGERYIWFHAASLGEFEQGRPLMERIRRDYPQYKLLLTFFSPSGYEVRKDYEGADIICYLPLDTPLNAIRFVKTVRPVMAFFIKYEFWQNYYKVLQHYHIPIYSVSSIFRPEQVFFKWWGGRYYKVLTRVTHFFVQNEFSKHLLATRGVFNVTVVGDTRFDRVVEIAQQAKVLPKVEQFKQNQPVFVAGSSWEPDEELFVRYFNEHPEWKLIIAPHVVNEEHLTALEQQLQMKTVRYSQFTEADADARCLLIDCYGLLSSIYRYGEIAYVGGGFGVGIHNVLEAAVWGVPVLFGPNNQRFQEACQLLETGGGFEVTGWDTLQQQLNILVQDTARRATAGQASGAYVQSKAGAADKILKKVEFA